MLTAIGDVLREAYRRGWITTRDGNISLRMSLDGKISDFMYITPKGVRKNTIHPEDIIKLNINGVPGEFAVSTEFMMHRSLLWDAKSTRSVVHLHPTYTVAAIHAGIDLQYIAKQFPEISRYTKVGPTVPVYDAGSYKLAEKTAMALRGEDVTPPGIESLDEVIYDIVGQANHGVCAVGKHPWDAFEHIERLEHICQIVLLGRKTEPMILQGNY